MRTWKKIVREYFTFNNRERRGLLVFMFLLFILISIHAVVRNIPQAVPSISYQDLEIVDDFVEAEATKVDFQVSETTSKPAIKWTSFDPNSAGEQELVQLGLKEYVAKRLVKYRTKGGRFRSMSDLSKIYGIDPEWIAEAEPFAQFAVEDQKTANYDTQFTDNRLDRIEVPRVKIELNSAESLELVELPWIGPYFAKEIFELREDLGGFRDYLQLLEIYNIKDEAIESIIENSTLDTSLVTPINLNSCDVKRLAYHPYLTWRQAKIIVNYRDQHGPYQNIAIIKETDVIGDSVYLKIAPYLTVD